MPFGNWILDFLIFLCLTSGFYFGWKRGFLKVVLKTFSGLFSAIMALCFFEKLGLVLKDRYVFDIVHAKISDALAGLGVGADAASMADAVPKGMQSVAALVGIDLASVAEGAIASGQNALSEFATGASHSISQFISSVIAFFILFLGIFLVLRLLSTPISAIIMKLPILGHLNRFLGSVFGALTALIIAWLFVKLVGFLDVTFELSFIEVKDAWAAGPFYRFSLLM